MLFNQLKALSVRQISFLKKNNFKTKYFSMAEISWFSAFRIQNLIFLNFQITSQVEMYFSYIIRISHTLETKLNILTDRKYFHKSVLM